MAIHCHVSVIAVSHLFRGTANLTLTSDDSWMISHLTQLNAIIVNDACLEMCDSRKWLFIFYWMGGSCVLWEVPSHPAMVTLPHMTKNKTPLRATHQLFEERFKILALFSEPAGHPFPHLEWRTDNSTSHNGTNVFSHHPPMDFSHQDLQWQCEWNWIQLMV